MPKVVKPKIEEVAETKRAVLDAAFADDMGESCPQHVSNTDEHRKKASALKKQGKDAFANKNYMGIYKM